MTNKPKNARPSVEDYLRALSYFVLMVWSVLFFLFPPVAFLSEVAEISLFIWLSVTFLGAAMAFIGSLARIDIKLEFPGLLLALVGPVFYALSQLYLSIYPPLTTTVPNQRVALTAFAFFAVSALLPRIGGLLVAKNRLKGSVQ